MYDNEKIDDCYITRREGLKYLRKYFESCEDIGDFERELYDCFEIPQDGFCTITQTNHIIEVQYMSSFNGRANILKIDADTYINISTGEIKNFNKTNSRKDSYNSLRQTFKKLRYLINNNFVGSANELFLTLTYKKNMTNTYVLYDDFRKFIKRLRYRFSEVPSIDYICIVEPQGRGAWHCHVLLRFNGVKTAFIAKEELSDLWGHGFVYIDSLKDVDNIGAYLSAYLTDMNVSDDSSAEKKYKKGARLSLYPPGLNIYRKSRGIVFPERQRIKVSDIKKYVGEGHLTYFTNSAIKNGDFESYVSCFYYNLKR